MAEQDYAIEQDPGSAFEERMRQKEASEQAEAALKQQSAAADKPVHPSQMLVSLADNGFIFAPINAPGVKIATSPLILAEIVKAWAEKHEELRPKS